ncbi:MAG: hypothetical protein LBC74_01560 [Planctomycetaceae bacterium]|nr:hypothetical protein [Planctomycetaceae bacterium]
MTLHILWITAQNETGESDLKLQKTRPPALTSVGEETFDYIPLEEHNHQIKDYYFGKGKGCALEKNAILRFILNLRIGSNDAVMVYYRGHGAYDKQDQTNKFVAKQYYEFLNDNGSVDYLPHSDVRLAVEKLNPRLAVFIRDCCGSWRAVPTRGVVAEREDLVYSSAPESAVPRRPRREQKLFLSLFAQSRGVVDIASANVGFAALAQFVPDDTKIKGEGFFGEPKRETLDKYVMCGTVFSNSFDKIFDNKRSQSLSWEQFFGALQAECRDRFRKEKPDSSLIKECGTHSPRYFVLGGIYAVKNFEQLLADSWMKDGLEYFGFNGEPVFAGVLLTHVEKGSRGEAYGLEARKEFEGKQISDIIYAIDEIPVTTAHELDLACRVMGADGALTFTLINGRDGNVQDFAFPNIRAKIVEKDSPP